jgi:hypothetical protein
MAMGRGLTALQKLKQHVGISLEEFAIGLGYTRDSSVSFEADLQRSISAREKEGRHGGEQIVIGLHRGHR